VIRVAALALSLLGAPAGAPPIPVVMPTRMPVSEAPPSGPFPSRGPVQEQREWVAAFTAYWRGNPVGFVRQNFGVEPDEWQVDVLWGLLDERNPRIAMSACKGPGKSAVLAWCGWWILTCHPGAQGNALSITGANLRDNLWKELATWYRKSAALRALLSLQKTRIASRETPDTWFLSARSFAQGADPDEQANSLAGLHAPFVFYLLDEIGDMAPGVLGAAKGVFYVEGQRGWILAAGNPTSHDGALYWATGVDSSQWRIVNITGDPEDPKRSPRISLEQAQADIDSLGRDNPWVQVNILGKFPPQGSNQLLGPNEVAARIGASVTPDQFRDQAIIWGLDPARSERSGADEAALARRQGLLTHPFHTWRGMTGTALGDAVALLLTESQRDGSHGGYPDKVFVDVGGVGTSAYDRLVHLGWGHLVVPVDFGGRPMDGRKYHDRRTEMWVTGAEYLQERPCSLPVDNTFRGELTVPRYHFRRINRSTKFILESKDEMKARGKKSPNRADAWMLTFAAPVRPRSRDALSRSLGADSVQRAKMDYDPIWGDA